MTLELTKRSASWWSVAFPGGAPGPPEPKSQENPSMQKLEAKIGEQVVTKCLEREVKLGFLAVLGLKSSGSSHFRAPNTVKYRSSVAFEAE